jgi:uncharacterized RDD family membrane protein YckC
VADQRRYLGASFPSACFADRTCLPQRLLPMSGRSSILGAMREVYRVRTPENVVFEHELAQIPARAAAWGIDVLVMIAIVLVAERVLAGLAPALGLGVALTITVFFVVHWFYFALSEWWSGGRTVGKRLIGLRVLDARGFRVGFVQALVRNLVRAVDFLPGLYLVGGLSALLDRHGRRLGDLAADTVVVRERNTPAPAAIVPPSERHNSFLADPAVRLAARRVTAPERDAMIALGLRRESLPLVVRHELFGRLAEHLEARLGVPRPPYFSPEKYVLNLTAVVLESHRAPGEGPTRASRSWRVGSPEGAHGEGAPPHRPG